MPFVAVVFLVFALFMAARVPRGSLATWLGLVLFSFGCCILGLLGLITRFGNYRLEGLIALPLDQPAVIGDLLGHLSLFSFIRFRLWSLVAFVVSVLGFSYSYTGQKWRRGRILSLLGWGLPTVLLLWYHDPEHMFIMFKTGAALAGKTRAWEAWVAGLARWDFLSTIFITLALAYALGRLVLLGIRSTIQQKQAQVFCLGLGHAVIAGFFIFLFCLGPAKVLNGRAMATTLLPAAGYPVFDVGLLLAVPFAGLLALGAVILSIWRFGFLGPWHFGTKDLDRQIHSANQAVRLALHSFKNRFLGVQMALDLACLDLKDAPGAGEARARIETAREICREALAQLDTLHVQAGKLGISPVACSWPEIWAEARRRCAGRETGVVLTVRGERAPARIYGDREHLTAVLENLLHNAFDALADKPAAAIDVEIGSEHEWGFVRIADNGPGISRRELRKVFRPFYTTKSTRNNWGMGLAYCHRVIKAHGGFINLRTRPGAGTMVEVVLRCR